MNYKKAIVYLDGISSQITNRDRILANIGFALNMLMIPFEIYDNSEEGFAKLRSDMNQEHTLYILNDSLAYHLCEEANILLCRSIPWVTSSAKLSTIGRITHEVMATDTTFLMSIIARNEVMRQEFNEEAARTILLTDDYMPEDFEAFGRFGHAAWSYTNLRKHDIHFEVFFHQSDKMPKVNDMLEMGIKLFRNPDDLLVIANRDICLTKEFSGIVRSYMDSRNIDACFAHRVDVNSNGLLSYNTICKMEPSSGMDLFVFRPSFNFNELRTANLYLGRIGWDSFWASKIKHRLPFNVCYHTPHQSKWMNGAEENKANLKVISEHGGLKSNSDGNSVWFEKIS